MMSMRSRRCRKQRRGVMQTCLSTPLKRFSLIFSLHEDIVVARAGGQRSTGGAGA